jgi:hypothetical protein
MGILSLLKIPATIISANFVALQLILTIAIMLHLITCYREISRGNIQFTQHERLKAALTEKLAPCFFQQYNIEIVIRVQRPINLRREFSVCCEPNFRTTHLQ